MFYGDENSTYRLLIKEPDIWIINVNGESAPISVSEEVLGQMNEVPADSVIPPYTPPKWIRKEGERRIEIIKPLIESEQCIIDSDKRVEISNLIAQEHGISTRTVSRYYSIRIWQKASMDFSRPSERGNQARRPRTRQASVYKVYKQD